MICINHHLNSKNFEIVLLSSNKYFLYSIKSTWESATPLCMDYTFDLISVFDIFDKNIFDIK